MCGPGASLERVPWVPRHIVELGGQDEFYFFMIMLHFNHYRPVHPNLENQLLELCYTFSRLGWTGLYKIRVFVTSIAAVKFEK